MTTAAEERTDARSSTWYGRASLVAALTSLGVGALLAFALFDSWKRGWLNLDGAFSLGAVTLALGSLWLALIVAGVALGIVALALRQGRRSRVVGAIALSVASCLALAAVAFVAPGPRHPSDAALIDDFAKNGPAFAKIEARIGAREEVDADILRSLGILGVDSVDSGYSLTVSSIGLVPSGSSKGYFYSAARPGCMVSDLDRAHVVDDIVFRHLRGRWYIYYETW